MAGSCRLRRLNRDLGTSATDGWWATLRAGRASTAGKVRAPPAPQDLSPERPRAAGLRFVRSASEGTRSLPLLGGDPVLPARGRLRGVALAGSPRRPA